MQRLIFVIAVLLAHTATSETIYLNKSTDKPYSLDVLNSSAYETVIRFRLNNFEREEIEIEDRNVATIAIKGVTNHNIKGMPSLPKFSRDILIPQDADPSIKVTHYNSAKMDLGIVAPSKGTIYRNQNPAAIPYTFADFYQGKRDEAAFPEGNVKIKKTFQMRGMRGLTIEINPMAFNPVSGKTEIIDNLIFSIRNNSQTGKFVSDDRRSGVHVFNKMYATHFMNWDEINSDTTVIIPNAHEVGETGDLLIITADKFAGDLPSFVSWKRQMGYPTKLVKLSDVGRDYRAIKDYIQKEYDSSKSLAFVILVGDAEDMPFHPGKSGNARGNEADPMYGLVEGNDSYPDVIIARFSVKNSTELANVIARSIDYEKSPRSGDWYKGAVGIASNEGSPTDYERADLLKQNLMSATYTVVDDHYDPGANANGISQSINAGRGVINYIGHGSQTAWVTGWFNNSHINQLKNDGMLPMIISVACVNGDFNYKYGDAFAEAWLKAGTASKPTGAIAIFASSTNQSWVPPTVGQLKVAEMIAAGSMHTIGGLMFNGSVAVLEDGDSTAEQTFETWHIFGDPTVRLQTSAPRAANVILPDAIDAPSWSRSLNVGQSDLHVAITQDDHLIAAGISDHEGLVHFSKSIEQLSGTHTVTISGAGTVPYAAKIEFN